MQDASKFWRNGTRLRSEFEKIRDCFLEDPSLAKFSDPDARKKQAGRLAFDAVRDALAGGELQSAGKPNNLGSGNPLFIDAQFWVGAEINILENAAWTPTQTFSDIKVGCSNLALSGPTISSSAVGESTALPSTVQKIPSNAKLRELAIESCFETKRIDFDDMGPTERWGNYLAWIYEHYPQVDTEGLGFAWKSFESDETKFKKSKAVLPPKK